MSDAEDFEVPAERRSRNPLMTAVGYKLFNRIRQHPHAPRWNYVVGDRVTAEDLAAVEAFRERQQSHPPRLAPEPPPALVEWVRRMRERSAAFRARVPDGFDIERDWAAIPTMCREDIAVRPEDVIPSDADLARLIVYDTSGTTGHALVVPHHPAAMAKNHPLIEYALARHGVRPPFGPERVACVNLGAQVHTVVFPNVFSVWNQAGFAKVNLHPKAWREPDDAARFFKDLAPFFLTGDPVGWAEMMRWALPVRPAALLSTAVALSDGFRRRLEERYACPVIDWYSTTETGPVAFSAPDGHGMEIVAPDIHVELLDEAGHLVGPGTRGEITVTGGRNPYLPLLRYRTGDWAALQEVTDAEGRLSLRLTELEGRDPVFFRATDGSIVNPVDIGRILREQPFVQHRFVQHEDGSCEVVIRPAAGSSVDKDLIQEGLRALFGPARKITVRTNSRLSASSRGEKVYPYVSEMK
ncbi:MAG: AMP-binding protein [Kiritimatiellae bacterium]|nr:AMP-binding protein [Kiritimatiellia bacterium]